MKYIIRLFSLKQSYYLSNVKNIEILNNCIIHNKLFFLCLSNCNLVSTIISKMSYKIWTDKTASANY